MTQRNQIPMAVQLEKPGYVKIGDSYYETDMLLEYMEAHDQTFWEVKRDLIKLQCGEKV